MYVYNGQHELSQWLIQIVTAEARVDEFDGKYATIKCNDTFTIISTDDAGPYMLFVPQYDEIGRVINVPNNKRWHVVLLNGVMHWLDHELLQFSRLVSDP
jgi:hypothetical protein